MKVDLSQSYMSQVLTALAYNGGEQARDTLLELRRQGIGLPAWIVLKLGIQAEGAGKA